MASISPEVERLLPLIQQYLPGDPAKWMWVIQHESGGNPQAVGDGGAAWGLFQSHHIPAGSDIVTQFKDAARLYSNDAMNGGTGFGDWGEGRLYNGKPFGSLGNNPYGGSGVTTPTPRQSFVDYLKEYMSAIGMPPPDPNDPKYKPSPISQGGKPIEPGTSYEDDLATWQERALKAAPQARQAWSAEQKSAGGDVTPQQGITNMISLLNAQVLAGNLDATQAQNKLSAFINMQKNALDLGQQQLTANAEMDKYGPGWSGNYGDLGGGFAQFAKEIGADPASMKVGYTTPKPFDPVAAYTANMQLMGGAGGPPTEAGPGAASQSIAALIQGLVNGGAYGGSSATGNDGGGFPSWGTGTGGSSATITPPPSSASILPPGISPIPNGPSQESPPAILPSYPNQAPPPLQTLPYSPSADGGLSTWQQMFAPFATAGR